MSNWPGIRLLQWCKEFHKGEIMVGEVYISDNSGNRIPGDAHCPDPVPASGITLAIDGNEQTEELVGGEMYAITYIDAVAKKMLASITGVTTTDANIEWVFAANETYVFHMPMDKTTFYYCGDTAQTSAYLRKLAK